MFQIGCFDLSFLLLRPSALCSHLFRFSVNKHDDDDELEGSPRDFELRSRLGSASVRGFGLGFRSALFGLGPSSRSVRDFARLG